MKYLHRGLLNCPDAVPFAPKKIRQAFALLTCVITMSSVSRITHKFVLHYGDSTAAEYNDANKTTLTSKNYKQKGEG